MKVILTTGAVVLAVLTLTQTASALSVFVHNSNVPPQGAQVQYIVRDTTARYYYIFYRTVTTDGEIELPLPVQFEQGDIVTVTDNMTSPYVRSELSEAGALGDQGVDVWFNLEAP